MNTTHATAPVAYRVVRGDAATDRAAVLAIWERNLGAAPGRAGKFDWFYLDGPFGPALFQILRHEATGAYVGTAAIGRRLMQYRGRDLRAGVLADMAVDAIHRSLGPAMLLQAELARSAVGEFDFVYGFPNRAASSVMRRMGYPVLSRIPRYVRILRHHAYLERRLPRLLARPFGALLDALRHVLDGAWSRSTRTPVAQWCERADERMERLWQRSAPADTLIAPRGLAWLDWRFDRFPGQRARYLVLSEPGEDSVQAWFACHAEGASLHVRDFWSIDAAQGVGSRWIGALIRSARLAGYATIDFEYAAPQAKLAHWLAQGFVEREHRFVVGRWVADAARPFPEDFHFTAADEDI